MPEQDVFQNDVEVRTDIPQQAEVRQYVSSVSVGNVTTLPAGSQATVENVGTEEHAIFDFGLPKGDAGSMWGELAGNIEDQTDLNTLLTGLRTDVDVKAPLASPALTGTPTAPTAVDDTNTTQIATTAFVKNAITNLQSYINSMVANMLGRINFSSAAQVGINYSVTVNQYDAITSQSSSTYTIPSNGYITYKGIGSTSVTWASGARMTRVDFSVSGVSVNNGSVDLTLIQGNLIPVSAGDVLRVFGTATQSGSNPAAGTGTISNAIILMFYPQKS